MLASDLNNREFVGAQNPDELIPVEFYWHEPIDWNKQQDTGKIVRGPKVPYVRIVCQGLAQSVIETPVRDEHKTRWPRKWLAWQIQEGLVAGTSDDIPGWKLSDWPAISPDQLRELQHLRYSTVEQLAAASDAQVQGMGLGGLGLREQARVALKERAREAVKAELGEQEKTIAELRAKDAAREKELKEMREMILLMQSAPREPTKKRGRPPKAKEEPQAA